MPISHRILTLTSVPKVDQLKISYSFLRFSSNNLQPFPLFVILGIACLMYLSLRRHWEHSEMWWPRLFRHHGEIAWDDYEKDYSDLPREVLVPHKVAEVKREAIRLIEAADKDMRDILQVPAPALMPHCTTKK